MIHCILDDKIHIIISRWAKASYKLKPWWAKMLFSNKECVYFGWYAMNIYDKYLWLNVHFNLSSITFWGIYLKLNTSCEYFHTVILMHSISIITMWMFSSFITCVMIYFALENHANNDKHWNNKVYKRLVNYKFWWPYFSIISNFQQIFLWGYILQVTVDHISHSFIILFSYWNLTFLIWLNGSLT